MRVKINVTLEDFDRAVRQAIMRDKGKVSIAGEIIRFCGIYARQERIYNQRLANLKRSK